MSRRDEHAADNEDFPDKHVKVDGSTEGGACLTGHESGRKSAPPGYVTEVSCNYRWQGFKRALDDKSIYNNKAPVGKRVTQTAWGRAGGRGWNQPAAKSAWNVTATGVNFRTSCNKPYWHEAHHIVPNGELRDSINAVGKGKQSGIYRAVIRLGLLEEKYNLNHKPNMIILPMDGNVAKHVGLPRHRQNAAVWSHKRTVPTFVAGSTRFSDRFVRRNLPTERSRPYKACKTQIVNVSRTTRSQIVAAGGNVSIDDASASFE